MYSRRPEADPGAAALDLLEVEDLDPSLSAQTVSPDPFSHFKPISAAAFLP